MEECLLSVIVPVYNTEPYLRKCIESVCNQTYKNLEIILVDDGSTDLSGTICDKFAAKDSRIKVIHKENEGLVSARKAGVLAARGEYIANIDGDDYIDLEMFKTMMQVALQQGVDMVQCGLFNQNCEGEIVSEWGAYPAFYVNYGVSPEDKLFHLSNWLLDREGVGQYKSRGYLGSQVVTKVIKINVAMEYLNVPEDMSFGEDFVAHLYFLKAINSVASVNEQFYHYIYRNDSITRQNDMVKRIYNESRFVYSVYSMIQSLFPELPDDVLRDWLMFRQKIIFQMSKNLFENKANSLRKFTRIRSYEKPEEFFDKKIVVYGAGKVGRDYINHLSEYSRINIVAWVDKNPAKYSYDFRKVDTRDCLRNLFFDYLIIAVAKKELADAIRYELITNDVDSHKIIWRKPVL